VTACIDETTGIWAYLCRIIKIKGSLILLLGRGDNNYDKRAMPLAVFFVLSFVTVLVTFM
jgi:hypothetical protein